MIYYISLTICSFIFYAFLITIYMTKIKTQSLRTTVFIIILSLCGLFGLSEILTFCLYELNLPRWIVDLSWTIHWIICSITFWAFFNYVAYISYKLNAKKYIDIIKYNSITRISFLILLIDLILLMFALPQETLDFNNLDLQSKYSIVYCSVMAITYAIILITKRKSLLHKERKSIFFAICIFCIFLALQAIFPSFSSVPFGFFAVCYALYFNSENPDLRLLDDVTVIKEKIDAETKTKNNLLLNMTDDIKVPTSLIESISKELSVLDPNDKEQLIKLTDELAITGNNLLDIINNILNITNIESSQTNLIERKYSLKELLNDLTTTTLKKIGSKKITFVINADKTMASILLGDMGKLSQAVLNVLNNAVENTNVGRITFTITSTNSNGIEELLFKIADTGNGIKDEDKDKIFSQNLDKKGGLGLPITKKYIESMGGKVWFESIYQAGSTFYIQVGQKIIDSTPIGDIIYENKKENTTEYINCKGFKALIVDDNELNNRVTKKFLERYNFEVDYVLSSEECIYNIKSEKKYDIIFLDYDMPDMNGVELLHSLKSLEGYKIPPVIMLTANTMTGMKEKYLKEGFNDYLAKPINSQELDKVINKFFKVKQ